MFSEFEVRDDAGSVVVDHATGGTGGL